MTEVTIPSNRSVDQRRSGILCHLTSLPSAFGIGDLGPEAVRFIEFLAAAGQSVWQMLPVCPPAHNHSPYSCYSAFAGNPLMISPEGLVTDGLLTDLEIGPHRQETFHDESDFEAAETIRQSLLPIAFQRYASGDFEELTIDFDQFVDVQSGWLDDFALFESAIRHFDELDWTKWPEDLSKRTPEALKKFSTQFEKQIEYSKFVQFVFDRQWKRLRVVASENGMELCGDMPIFVAHESADVWSHPTEFCLNSDGRPARVAGVPPDYFSKTGQLWGNPQYDWERMEANDYAWWTQRIQRALQQFDSLRLDHFRGFEAYWEIPANAKTAVGGKWVKGPGANPFEAAEKVLGKLPLIAEDLGLITEEVHALREQLGFPGMRVLQFGLDGDENEYHHPSNYPENCVAYTGTHDNDTLIGWHASRAKNAAFKHHVVDLLGFDPNADYRLNDSLHWKWIEVILGTPPRLTLFPIQDLLGLGNESRMNLPGKAKGNWQWRLVPGQLDESHRERMRKLTQDSSRLI